MRKAEDFIRAAKDGVYGDGGFTFDVLADSHPEAAEVAFAVCNSSPSELHCDTGYLDDVRRYRREGNRSLSVGDAVLLERVEQSEPEDGRYGVASIGFVRF